MNSKGKHYHGNVRGSSKPTAESKIYEEETEYEVKRAPALKWPERWKKNFGSAGFYGMLIVGAVLMLTLAVMPMFFIYVKNYSSINLKQILPTMLSSYWIYLAAYLVITVITASPAAGAVIAGTGVYFAFNFGKLSTFAAKLFGESAMYVGGIVLWIVLAVLAVLVMLLLRRQQDVVSVFTAILTAVFLMLIVVNGLGVRKDIIKDFSAAPAPVQTPAPAESELPENAEPVEENVVEDIKSEYELAREQLASMDLAAGTPNIYFFLLDEMAGFDEIEEFYGYDTTEYKEFLTANNVNFSSSSHGEYRDTYNNLGDLFSLTRGAAYLPNPNTYSVAEMSPGTPLRTVLEDNDYNLFKMSLSGRAFRQLPSLLKSLETQAVYTTEDGLTAEDIALENSIMQILINSRRPTETVLADGLLTTEEILASDAYGKLESDKKQIVKSTLEIFDFFESPENIVPNSGIAYFSYMKPSHVPLLFNADGSILEDAVNQRNWRDLEIYRGCYEFALAHIQNVITNILDNDPDCVIFIMSDHGVRYHVSTTLKHEVEIDKDSERNVMNLLYFRGQPLNIEGLYPTDTIRLVINLLELDDMPLEGEITMEQIRAVDTAAEG